jgi:hypothetical protein
VALIKASSTTLMTSKTSSVSVTSSTSKFSFASETSSMSAMSKTSSQTSSISKSSGPRTITSAAPAAMQSHYGQWGGTGWQVRQLVHLGLLAVLSVRPGMIDVFDRSNYAC